MYAFILTLKFSECLKKRESKTENEVRMIKVYILHARFKDCGIMGGGGRKGRKLLADNSCKYLAILIK